MTVRDHGAAILANLGGRRESGFLRRESGFWADLLRAMWPTHTAKSFARRTGTSISYAERVLAGDRGLSLPTFLSLCDAPDGGEVMLQALRAAGIDQPWVREFERAILRDDTRRRIKELRRKLDRLSQHDDG